MTKSSASNKASRRRAPQPEANSPAGTAEGPSKTGELKGKLGILVTLLRRPDGATVHDLAQATGWQVHSVRGAMAGALKKQRGLNIVSVKTETGRVYRITEEQA
jgi:hypothetical protein